MCENEGKRMDGWNILLKDVGKGKVFQCVCPTNTKLQHHAVDVVTPSVACESKLSTWTYAFTVQTFFFHQGVVMEKLQQNKNSSAVNTRKPATI